MSNDSRSTASRSAAVVGAGLSGLVAAGELDQQGWQVRVFEQARGTGGRMSRRREGEHHFDHGAQYFTARSDSFRRRVEEWTTAGWVQRWSARTAIVRHARVEPLEDHEARYVGVPGMSTVCRQLAENLDVELDTSVLRVHRQGDRWQVLRDDGEELGRFDVVLMSTPPRQAIPLLAEAADLARSAAAVGMDPCWAVMAIFPKSLGQRFDAAFVHESSLTWVANNGSKPKRPEGEAWVLHASPQWSTAHLALSPQAAAERLVAAFLEAIGTPAVTPSFVTAHLWRYSIARNPLERGSLWDPQRRIGACGDWCRGSRVEGAFLSGRAAAERILADCA